MEVPIQLHANAVLPSRSRPDDAGYDLCAREDMIVAPQERALVKTGLTMAIPAGCCAFVIPRSGLALRHGITVLNAPGLIDSGYRGEVGVVLYNSSSSEEFKISVGDRIAQISFLKLEEVSFLATDRLDSTDRGTGGFGHTGR